MAPKKKSTRSRKISVETSARSRKIPRKVYVVSRGYRTGEYFVDCPYTSYLSALTHVVKTIRRSLPERMTGLVPLQLQVLDRLCRDWLRDKSSENYALRIFEEYDLRRSLQSPGFRITSHFIRN